jgi:hypothetical protein
MPEPERLAAMSLRKIAERFLLLFATLLVACSHTIESPELSATQGGVAPDLVCNEQLTTDVTIRGDGMTPMPSQTLQEPTALILPSITLSRKLDVAGKAASGDKAVPDDAASPEQSRVKWVSEQEMHFQVDPGLKLDPGLYDVEVQNPDGQHGSSWNGALLAVPRPTLTAVAPDIFCDAEEDQTVTVTGTTILSVGKSLPTVQVGDKVLPASKVDGCADAPGTHAAGPVKICTSATFIVPKGTLKPGPYGVKLTNPATAACVSSDAITVTVVPPPTVASIVPDVMCDAEEDQGFLVNGTGFLTMGKDKPTVRIGDKDFTPTSVDGCKAVPGTFVEGAVATCTSMKVTIPKGTFPPGDFPVVVTNPKPADCKSLESVSLHVAAPPAIAKIEADLVCDAEGDQTMTITGTGFLTMGKDEPTITVGKETFAPTQVGGCTKVPGTFAEGEIQDCKTLTFVIKAATFPPGAYPVVVTNPKPADCHSLEPVDLTIVPPPAVASIAPDLVCDAEGDQTLTITGSGFLTVGDTKPTVMLGNQSFPASKLDGCQPVKDPSQGKFAEGDVTLCTSLTFVAPKGALTPGDYAVSVVNPTPAGCTSEEKVNLHVSAPPVIASLAPTSVCDAQGDQQLVITGTGFLVVGGQAPSVTIGALGMAPTPGGCVDVAGTFVEGVVQECTTLTVTIKKGALAKGAYPVFVKNPAPADCGSTDGTTITIEDPPMVASVKPATICAGGGKLTIAGSGFLPNANVTLVGNGQSLASQNTVVSAPGDQIVATMGGGAIPGNSYDLVVANGDGCSDPAPHQKVTAVQGPVAFFADPGVVYNGINTRVTVYATTLALPLPANAVTIVPTGQNAPVTTLQWAAVPNHPNRVQVIVPVNQAPGTYDLIMNDATGCQTILVGALTVTATLEVTIKRVTPSFGYTGSETAVTIDRDKAAAPPADKPFVATPRAFLNPSNPQPSDVAIPLASVAFADDARLTAVVPRNQPVHGYDLVVVNPDGTVGLLKNAFTVQATPPPTIAAVTPASIVAASGQIVSVSGKNFSGSTVTASCVDANGNAVAPPKVATQAEVCDAQKNCTQQAMIDGSTLAVGSICVLRLTNADGSYADYSAIGVTNASLNLDSPHTGTAMNTARRALVASSIDATAAARYVYAIGGDGGQAAQNAPFDTAEFAPVDLYGNMGAWQVARNKLKTPRSFASVATLGRYVYVVGGFDGTNPLGSAERAMVLNPSEVPALDVDDIVPAATGLDAGYWFYRVSAVYTNADVDNPGGESLASDEFIVKVPVFPGKKIQVVLTWKAPVDALDAPLPNLAGYRVYRTPTVNGASGGEVLVATVGANTTKWTDDGTAQPGVETPLPLGSTGKWTSLPNMAVPRQGAAGAVAFDPADKTKAYVYSLLGLSANNQVVGTYEFLPVTIQTNGHQTFSAAFVTGAQQSAQPRWQHGAWVADHTVSSAITAGDTYVYVGGGILANLSAAGKVEAGKVLAGGDLGTLSDTPKDFTSTAAGYGVCAANGQLFTFGGAGAAPSSGARSALITAPAPSLSNNSWNSEGLNMTEPRYLMGSAVQSSFIFLVGGRTNSAASATTELVIW